MVVKPLQDFAIVIDPGHGGADPGAVDGINPKEGDNLYTEEEDVNLAVGLLLHNALVAQGARSTMTRSSDWYPSLQQRVDMARKFGANAFISIHANSATPKAAGIETLYHPGSLSGKRLAELVQQELIRATKAPNRGTKPRPNLVVLNGTNKYGIPGILVEIGFISNPAEEARLNAKQYQQVVADALARALVRFKKGEKA
ncbi:MAG: N-acetylmuramoyl-L-alanine amidase family protein [Carboxydocellales bacterium]